MCATLVAAEVTESGGAVRDFVSATVAPTRSIARWTMEKFAREQIRALVRSVFSDKAAHPVRQVVFSAVGSEIDVVDVCQRVAQTLAEENLGDVAVLGTGAELGEGCSLPLKQIATRLGRNLWSLQGQDSAIDGPGVGSLYSYLSTVRAKFAYSIVAAPPVGESDSAIGAAQFSDGVILVLSLRNTRRATALGVKHALEQAGARLLGTVLIDREFPIPASLYRRL